MGAFSPYEGFSFTLAWHSRHRGRSLLGPYQWCCSLLSGQTLGLYLLRVLILVLLIQETGNRSKQHYVALPGSQEPFYRLVSLPQLVR